VTAEVVTMPKKEVLVIYQNCLEILKKTKKDYLEMTVFML
jgi:hypothetical protein